MREELICARPMPVYGRITPAHAGRIIALFFRQFSAQDHPRACGKNIAAYIGISESTGSPPRMREESHSYIKWKLCGGITPAHAGRISRRKFARYVE